MTTWNIRCGDWLRHSADNYPDRACFVTETERFTFADVNTRVNRVADAMASQGVGHGDRVALFATDTPQYMETLLACMKLGATYVPLNFRLKQRELALLLQRSEPSLLYISPQYSDMVAATRGEAPTVRTIIGYDDCAAADTDYASFLSSGSDAEPDVEIHDDDLLGLAFTSGTTTLPKGVMHTQRLTKNLTYQTIVERRLRDQAFHYSAAPLYHVAGMIYALAGVVRGYTSLILPSFDPQVVLDWLQRGEITGCFLVPTMISTLLQQPDVEDGDYSSLESIAYGAAPMSPTLLRRAMSTFGCDFINMFGAGTEAGLQTILLPEDHRRALKGHEHLLGSIGKPAFNVDLRLVDDAMNDVPVGEVGEIVTRSDGVMAGYLEMPEETAEVLVDGWFRGGDLARRDEEGYLYLEGRKKDMIIRGGENIYPVEIESVLAEIPGVVEVAVVGAPDEHWGEIVHAHVGMAPGAHFDEEAARQMCRSRLASYKVPATFHVHEELPKNASGKILKRELRKHPADMEPAS